MTTKDILIHQIEQLPVEIQNQVADFVQFLIIMHEIPVIPIQSEKEISKETKKELDTRYKALKENQERAVSWESAKQRILQKIENYAIQSNP